MDRLFSDFGAQLLPKSSQNPLKMETKSNPSALRRKTYKFQWLSQFSRLFPERPTCLNYCKYQCRMTFRSFRFTSKNQKKCSKISLKTSPNPLKIEPGLLPKRHSKKQQEKAPQNRQKVKICFPTGSLGGGPPSPFSALFRLRATLGTKMVPRPPPRASGTPPGVTFSWFPINFGRRFW